MSVISIGLDGTGVGVASIGVAVASTGLRITVANNLLVRVGVVTVISVIALVASMVGMD